MNPIDAWPDEWSGRALEGVMLIETLVIVFVVACVTIAVLGHVLLLQAAFTPTEAQ